MTEEKYNNTIIELSGTTFGFWKGYLKEALNNFGFYKSDLPLLVNDSLNNYFDNKLFSQYLKDIEHQKFKSIKKWKILLFIQLF